MIRSMTGFGRCETEENNRRVTVEMRSVNNRYLDLSVKMPRKFGAFEAAVRAEVKKYLEDFSSAHPVLYKKLKSKYEQTVKKNGYIQIKINKQ